MKSNKDNPVIVGELCSPDEAEVTEIELQSEYANDFQALWQETVCIAAGTLAKELEGLSAESWKKAKRVKFKVGYQLIPTLQVEITPRD